MCGLKIYINKVGINLDLSQILFCSANKIRKKEKKKRTSALRFVVEKKKWKKEKEGRYRKE